MDRLDQFQQRAFRLAHRRARRATASICRAEPDRVRDRYGRNLSGSSLLVARRLVEAGVPFISVHAEIFGNYGHSYDMHENNFGMLKDLNLPILDQAYPGADSRTSTSAGLLDSTLVVVMGEMGRTPAGQRQGRPRPLAAVRLQPADRRRRQAGTVYGATDKHRRLSRSATRSRPATSSRRSTTCSASTRT